MSPSSDSPLLALVGRTNVGKSTLFNRITGTRKALVAPTPGLTRDRRMAEVERDGYRFRLVDTGGMEFDPTAEFGPEIAEQATQAIEEAAAVWLVLDVTDGLTALDTELYRWLLRLKGSRKRPLIVVVNKVDNRRRDALAAEFYDLGCEHVVTVSALHGGGIGEALQFTAGDLPEMVISPDPSVVSPTGGPIRVAFMGKPNVGKSSLVNRILGESRMIVSETAGTTREPIDTPVRIDGRDYLLVDTAGIRRKARTKTYLDKLGALTSLGALGLADVAVLVIDAGDAVSEQDAKLAGRILEEGRAIVLAMNKWDLVESNPRAVADFEAGLGRKLRFLDYGTKVRVSAATGLGVERLFSEVTAAYEQFSRTIRTADLNRVVPAMILQHPPPSKGRSETRIFYGSQVGSSPPQFLFFTNHPESITAAYTRYVVNQLRYHFGFRGSPLMVEWKGREQEKPGREIRAQRRSPRTRKQG